MALIAPANRPPASSASASHTSMPTSCRPGRAAAAPGSAGVGEHQVARVVQVDARGLRRAHELGDEVLEARRIVEVREVARALEELQPAARHELLGAHAVDGGDDRVALAPDEQGRHGLREIEAVARVDALAADVDD